MLLILCTAPDADVAATLARGLVEASLAACVNVIPGIRSFYRWQGEVKDEGEVQLLIKTTAERYDALAAWIDAHHPYEVPELIAFDVTKGSRAYLAWAHEQTR
ncbi:MAG: divalent-cation tolerance protein CutA [Sandaracinaceae bacterium]